MKVQIFDPSDIDPTSSSRGGGRFIQLLKENLPEAQFINELQRVDAESALLIPFFDPFAKPVLNKRIAKKQIILIYDTIPLKYSSHFPVGLKGRYNAWKNKQTLRNFDAVVTISEVSKKDITRYLDVPKEKITVIYPTLSNKLQNLKSTSHSLLNITNYCIYVGDVNWNKNIVNIAKAIKITNIPCVFVGKAFEPLKSIQIKSGVEPAEGLPNGAICEAWEKAGSTESDLTFKFSHPWQLEFKQFIKEVYGNPLFIFPGYVSDNDLCVLYKNASLNILLSRDEGFGFSFLEASNQSTPSLLSDIPIFHEIALDTARFVSPENPEQIAEQLKLLMTNNELRKEMGKNSLSRADYFNSSTFKTKWEKILY
jgi:glycosyltransferase involved in cell wall biosynthesis